MFCPKCGTKNPDDGKYCRSCGVDIGNVPAALKGSGSLMLSDIEDGLSSLDMGCGTGSSSTRRRDSAEVYGDGIKSVISGVGFIVVAMALLFTGVAGGKVWWWAMLFPAFTFLAKGISDMMKSRRMEASRTAFFSSPAPPPGQPMNTTALPPNRTDYVPAAVESRYKTGDLVPPSVTDNTTKLLEIDKDGETMTLPKN